MQRRTCRRVRRLDGFGGDYFADPEYMHIFVI
jgi:hypothetical protein